jgi:CheY-like chemotaxis protein
MAHSTSKRVLIVEDDMLLSLLNERILNKLGHAVVGKATSGEDAVETFRKLKPDLVIMDISLNGDMDGVEATNRIREHAKIPVIFISGNTDRYEELRSTKEDINVFVPKPVTYNELAKAISSILPDKQIPPFFHSSKGRGLPPEIEKIRSSITPIRIPG